MSIANNQGIPNAVTRSLVCVNQEHESDYAGVLYNPYIPEPVAFGQIKDLLTALEAFFDTISFPQPFFETRSFLEGKPDGEPTAAPERFWDNSLFDRYRGDLATFVVEVHFRQNATWQGNVRWVERERSAAFRSTLELIKLVDSVMQNKSLEID